MDLAEEYKNQIKWREWDSYLLYLPVGEQDTVYDMGCGVGDVTSLLAKKASRVTGIDNNPELIKMAKRTNTADNISYMIADVFSLDYHSLPLCDGIWCSFAAAYFPNFTSVLKAWKNILKPGGWIALVEVNDLFGHQPLCPSTSKLFNDLLQIKNNRYDPEMGNKLKDMLIESGFTVFHEENKYDKELSFDGPAEPRIIEAWGYRFDRMHRFKEYVGENKFDDIKKEFLACLSGEDHTSRAIVKFIIARK